MLPVPVKHYPKDEIFTSIQFMFLLQINYQNLRQMLNACSARPTSPQGVA